MIVHQRQKRMDALLPGQIFLQSLIYSQFLGSIPNFLLQIKIFSVILQNNFYIDAAQLFLQFPLNLCKTNRYNLIKKALPAKGISLSFDHQTNHQPQAVQAAHIPHQRCAPKDQRHQNSSAREQLYMCQSAAIHHSCFRWQYHIENKRSFFRYSNFLLFS